MSHGIGQSGVSERVYWDRKFQERPETLPPPEPFLVRNLGLLRPGSVLDLACGDGRNAIFLAGVVTSMD